jgi:hypothetical protein
MRTISAETSTSDQEQAAERIDRAFKLSIGACSAAIIEGACAVSVVMKTFAFATAGSAVGLAGLAGFIHSATVRIPLIIFASIISIGNMVVLWRSWQIRISPAAHWRMRPLSTQERRRIIITVALCIATLAFVAAEIYSHHVLHPGEL